MTQGVLKLLQVEILATDLQVARVKNTDVKWLPTQYKNPLSKIKFSVCQLRQVDQQWVLNVLLDNLLLYPPNVRQNRA